MGGISRRRFMKEAMIAGSAITVFPTIWLRKTAAAYEPKTLVHPNVDNLRVVGVTDPRMTSATEPVCSWARQEELTVKDAIWENIDGLACSLAETRSPAEAWKTIFIKPPAKSWSDTVVAIKTNHIAQQHTRSAVLSKICHTLVSPLGVKPSNIHIYDACHGEGMRHETPFADLPEGCRIEDTWGGSVATTRIPKPWRNGDGKSKCLKYLVDGTVDILINISMCKGHSSRFGGFTMTMKNHLGTFSPGPAHREGALDYLIAMNKTPEILGPIDGKTGRVLFPRQQLCLVDALWASKSGPGGYPTHQPNFLAMGVLSPIVDYQMATKFRGEAMRWRPNMETTRRILTDFGYEEKDLPAGARILGI